MSTGSKWVDLRAAVAGGMHRFSVCACVKCDSSTSPATCYKASVGATQQVKFSLA